MVVPRSTTQQPFLCYIYFYDMRSARCESNVLLTGDESRVGLSTCDLADAAVVEELQHFGQIRGKQEGSLAQLAVLTSAKRVHLLLWKTQSRR